MKNLHKEIEKLKNNAISGEVNNSSKKTYEQVNELDEERNKHAIENLRREKRALEEELDTANTIMVEKEVLFKEKLETMSKQEEVLKKKDEEIALKEEFIKGQNARIKELESGKVIERYFDANGNEFFYDEKGNPYYRDGSGNIIYYDDEAQEVDEFEEEAPNTEVAPKPKGKNPSNAISKPKTNINKPKTPTTKK